MKFIKLAQTKIAVFIYSVILTLTVVFTLPATKKIIDPSSYYLKKYIELKVTCNLMSHNNDLLSEYIYKLKAKLRKIK